MKTKSQLTGTQKHAADNTPGNSDPQGASPVSTERTPVPRTLDSNALLGDQAMVQIQHLGEIYRLQTTRQGKLILTK